MTTEYSFPTHIIFEAGSISQCAELLGRCKKPLIVTDAGLLNSEILKSLISNLETDEISPTIFGDYQGNPMKSHVEAGVDVYRKGGCDALIAFGGGAAIDVAKAIGVLALNPGDLFDYALSHANPKAVAGDFPLFIAIPTTAGTGSEVGRSLVISDDDTHKKEIIFSPKMLPKHVILDPKLHLGLPPSITAATGMDALTHHLEAFLSPAYHPMCDAIALEGIRMCAKFLPIAYGHSQLGLCEDRHSGGNLSPEHLEARGQMINAAMMGAVAFQKGLGVVHSCAHALSTVCDLHHGLANAMMLQACMGWNAEAVPEKFEKIAAFIPSPRNGEGRREVIPTGKGGCSTKGSVEAVLSFLSSLHTQLELPKNLASLGVKPEHLDRLIEVAFADGCRLENCRPVTKEDFKKLFEQAI